MSSEHTNGCAAQPGTCCKTAIGSGLVITGVGADRVDADAGQPSASGPHDPSSNWVGSWFAQHCDENDGGLAAQPWRPRLQLDGMALFLDGVWFATEQDCLDFVRDNVLPRAGVTHA